VILDKLIGWTELLLRHPLWPHKDYVAVFDVERNLWRGSWPTSTTLLMLKAKGVENVVNFCAERQDDDLIRALGFNSMDLPTLDTQPPKLIDVERFITFCEQPTFGHCEAGVGRTGCFVAGFRVLKQGRAPETALAEARTFGRLTSEQVKWILALAK
jgi:protein-tyrosine phosphatase